MTEAQKAKVLKKRAEKEAKAAAKARAATSAGASGRRSRRSFCKRGSAGGRHARTLTGDAPRKRSGWRGNIDS